MSDDFFAKIDKKISEQDAAKAASESRQADGREFFTDIVRLAKPIAEDYVARLKERGINAKIEGRGSAFSVSLTYPDGDERSITMASSGSNNTPALIEYFREQGRSHKSREVPIDITNWKQDSFKEHLERLISSFISSSDNHGGART